MSKNLHIFIFANNSCTNTHRKKSRTSRNSSNWPEELTSSLLPSRLTRSSMLTARNSDKPSSRLEVPDTNTPWLSTTLPRLRSCNNPCLLPWRSRTCKGVWYVMYWVRFYNNISYFENFLGVEVKPHPPSLNHLHLRLFHRSHSNWLLFRLHSTSCTQAVNYTWRCTAPS